MNSKITLDVVQSKLLLEAFTARISLLEEHAEDYRNDIDLINFIDDIIEIKEFIFIVKELKEDLEFMIEKGKKTFTFKTKFSDQIRWSLNSVAYPLESQEDFMCEKIKQKIYKANAGRF
jgi:hypothetical protein